MYVDKMNRLDPAVATLLQRGVAIPACPLALDASRRLDERRQRALLRYYLAAGVGGIAVGVHTTQFAIRDPKVGLFEPVLSLAAEEFQRAEESRHLVRVAGVCGRTRQAVGEAELIRTLGYDAALLSLSAMKDASESALLAHCRRVVEVIPLIGFYLQPAVGGRALPYSFWRRFAEIENVVAIKIAPFNRYQTIDVVRAVAEAGRDDIALYTGNDDNIVMDLVTNFKFVVNGRAVRRQIVGGLLGHWSVWTRNAVDLLEECRRARGVKQPLSHDLISRSIEVTDCNAAFFDAAHGFAGCIAGLHEVLRRQGLLKGTWCLYPREKLSPGQAREIDRVYKAYPHLNDDAFVARHRDEWLR
jgi:dihydrodipicolinate synthase/N-acetylneuraminate lyase